MIKVLIADDHSVVRQGLKQIFGETSDIVVTDEAKEGLEVLEKVRENDYDVVLLDISMPGRSGLEILKQLREENPKLSILVLTMYPEKQYAIRVLKAGASGYLTKESRSDELIEAVRAVAQGRKYITSALAEKLAFGLEAGFKQQPHEALSDREFQVMCMIAQGKSIKEIGEELFLSAKTVSTYRTRILEKMGMKNNAELILYALKNQLLD